MFNKLYTKNKFIIANTHSKLNFTVLIIDSGIGGLLVYNEIRKLLPNLHYVYVFDNIAYPYGEKSKLTIIKRILKIINSIQKMYFLSLVVIACNTASIVTLSLLKKNFNFLLLV